MSKANRYLSVYLNDHLAGATAGVALAKRAAKSNKKTPLGKTLKNLAKEIGEDRAALIALMKELGIPARAYKRVPAALGEKLGRAKPNGHLLKRSPLSSLIELEGMSLGIEGKASLWRSLAAAGVKSKSCDFEDLQRRAESQRKRLEKHRGEAAKAALG
jgi:hypothetical protein